MFIRTHLVLGIFGILLFLPKVDYKFTFVVIGLIATLLPDIDNSYSRLGHKKIFRPLQFFVKHRGMMHSFTVCFLISLLFAFFPFTVRWALPFFLGYGLHLFTDAFTVFGITPFWPYKTVSKGFLRTGGHTERVLFWSLLVANLILVVAMVVTFLS